MPTKRVVAMTCGIGPTSKSTSPTVVIVFDVLIDFAKLHTTSTLCNEKTRPTRPRLLFVRGETLLRYAL
jgi:hypothetical protein